MEEGILPYHRVVKWNMQQFDSAVRPAVTAAASHPLV